MSTEFAFDRKKRSVSDKKEEETDENQIPRWQARLEAVRDWLPVWKREKELVARRDRLVREIEDRVRELLPYNNISIALPNQGLARPVRIEQEDGNEVAKRFGVQIDNFPVPGSLRAETKSVYFKNQPTHNTRGEKGPRSIFSNLFMDDKRAMRRANYELGKLLEALKELTSDQIPQVEARERVLREIAEATKTAIERVQTKAPMFPTQTEHRSYPTGDDYEMAVILGGNVDSLKQQRGSDPKSLPLFSDYGGVVNSLFIDRLIEAIENDQPYQLPHVHTTEENRYAIYVGEDKKRMILEVQAKHDDFYRPGTSRRFSISVNEEGGVADIRVLNSDNKSITADLIDDVVLKDRGLSGTTKDFQDLASVLAAINADPQSPDLSAFFPQNEAYLLVGENMQIELTLSAFDQIKRMEASLRKEAAAKQRNPGMPTVGSQTSAQEDLQYANQLATLVGLLEERHSAGKLRLKIDEGELDTGRVSESSTMSLDELLTVANQHRATK